MEKKHKEVQVNIWGFMNKIPAGTMFVPLIISAVITTICIHCGLNQSLWDYLGNPMKLLFGKTGQMYSIGIILFCTGTTLTVKDFKDLSKRGLWNILAKWVPALIISAIVFIFCGVRGFLGIDSILFTIAMTSANAALFVAIATPYSDSSDMAAFPIMLILAMPIVPFIFVSFFGKAQGDSSIWSILKPAVSMLLPFILGFVLGNLDKDLKNVFKIGNKLIIPFLGFQFGSAIDIVKAFSLDTLSASLLLTVIFLAMSSIFPYIVDRFILKRPGYLAIGTACLAGTALSVPEMFIGYNFNGEIYTEADASNCLAILAFVLLITNIMAPFFTKWTMNFYFKNHQKEAHDIFIKTHPELLAAVYDENGNYRTHHHNMVIFSKIFSIRSHKEEIDVESYKENYYKKSSELESTIDSILHHKEERDIIKEDIQHEVLKEIEESNLNFD